MSPKRRYIAAAVVDTLLIALVCSVVLEIVLLGDRSSEFVDRAFLICAVTMVVLLLFRDRIVGFATRRLLRIEYQPIPHWWQYPIKNMILALAACIYLLSKDVYDSVVGYPAKGPYWIGYIQTIVPFVLFVLDSYFQIGLRAAGIAVKGRK